MKLDKTFEVYLILLKLQHSLQIYPMSGNLTGGVLIVLAVGEHDLVLSLDNTGQADAI